MSSLNYRSSAVPAPMDPRMSTKSILIFINELNYHAFIITVHDPEQKSRGRTLVIENLLVSFTNSFAGTVFPPQELIRRADIVI